MTDTPKGTDETLCYYVQSMNVRRELVPVSKGDRVVAYRCLTYPVDGPKGGDTIVADQTEFEDVLIRMKLMRPRNVLEALFANFWRASDLDCLFTRRPSGSPPTETLLPILG